MVNNGIDFFFEDGGDFQENWFNCFSTTISVNVLKRCDNNRFAIDKIKKLGGMEYGLSEKDKDIGVVQKLKRYYHI